MLILMILAMILASVPGVYLVITSERTIRRLNVRPGMTLRDVW